MPPPVDCEYCGLLSNEENLQVFKLLGNRCQSLSTTVVQLFYTQPPHHSEWLKKGTGVLCFVKDNTRKNFFFRLFCLKRNMKIWEQEMYNNMEYVEATSFFHIFEGHDCMIAFNFANKEEARNLKIVVHQKIQARRRREEKRSRQINHSQTIPGPTVDLSGFKKTPDPAAKLAKRKRNITKADISTPMDFKHISHVGWNSASGFDINTEDEELKEFLKRLAGVSEQQLQDKSTREFLYDFVNSHGGRDAVVQSTVKTLPDINTPPPAVPPRGPPRGPHFRNAPPPPIPAKSNSVAHRKPRPAEPLPSMKPFPAPVPNAPPAPPPPPPPPPPPMEMPEKNEETNNAVPPPPPPPTVDTINSALLKSIRNGTTLKPVEERKLPTPQEDARGDLLSEIRKGCKLKPVEERDVKPIANPVAKAGGYDLADVLSRALAERNRAIHSEDDDDNSVSTDEEWED
ncbi:hypothetical protein NQ318_001469 [Aromia moschata]|uniref:Neural Wiskott-Aldrich syndrome protein n=1 Tax=Aromia moschata TaxID=1265417 RepID=A0AAV8YV26_9CUCU|nr:hypothetical protein NQ318_001469 [Aromia moschata]